MRLLYSFPHLPTLLLAFISSGHFACSSQDLPWPYNLPPHVKYYPEDEVVVKRSNDMLQRLRHEQPMVVKKMSPDPGEMFFLDYWLFQEHKSIVDGSTNTSIQPEFQPPTPLHAVLVPRSPRLLERYLRLPIPATNLFSKRDFVCPSGTNACTSINRPNVCCPSSSTCQIVPDTGLGDVGCCDASQICAGSLSQCPSDYTSCPNNPGGGCCLPGFACFQEGCAQTSTTVVFVVPSSTSTSSSSSATSPSTVIDTTTVVVTPTVPSTSSSPTPSSPTTITSTEIITNSPMSTSSSSQANSLVCSSGFRSCPASLGGGCCPTDRACDSVTCPALTSTADLSPPVRGTSSSPSTTNTDVVNGCPTGFYACSAYNPGGCCQVGRDCSSTSCLAATGVTVVSSGGITVVAPTGTPVSQGSLTGVCASGWSTCDANLGGGCCPSGFACGTAACTATVSGLTATQGKIVPNAAHRVINRMSLMQAWGFGVVLLVVTMVVV